MNKESSIVYHEVDFLVPVHRFNIRFSYVTKEGLPFIREFVLRLLHLSNLTPLELANYFGLSKRESDEAISDLLEKGDLKFNDNGKIELTAQSKVYFSSLGSTPKVSTVKEAAGALSFELAGFNCLGNKRSNEKWTHGIKLNVDNEVIANSQKLASTHFQKQFYQILEKEYITNIGDTEGSERPRLYTIDSITKIGQVPLRLTTQFTIDIDGVPIERGDFEVLENSDKAQELITSAVSENQGASNLAQIAQAMEMLGDDWTRNLFNNSSVDARKIIANRATATIEDEKTIPFVGAVYIRNNWDLIHKGLEAALDGISRPKDGKKLFMNWIAPADSFWGKSSRLLGCAHDFISLVNNGDRDHKLSTPILYLPVQDIGDRRSISMWQREFNNIIENTQGLSEGFLDGNVEIILLEDHFVAVCYHISRPESVPVTLPVGFISTDQNLIKNIQKITLNYLNGISSFEKPNDIGSLKRG